MTVRGMVQQLGLAMIPSLSRMSSLFTSGTTSGTFSFMRQAALLSMTSAPLSAASGPYINAMSPLAANRAMSMPLNAFSASGSPKREVAVAGHRQSLRAFRSKGDHAIAWKMPLREHAQHLLPDHAGRAYDSNV